MGVPFFDIKRHLAPIRHEIERAISLVLDSGDFILGREVFELEREVSAFVGTSGAVGVSSGTDGLLVSLMALEVGRGCEVITTPFTFFATAGCPVRLGANIKFVDIEPDTFNMDPYKALEAITEETRVIIPVHLFGHMADLKPLLEWSGRSGGAIVEDAAQAIGASCPLGMAGSVGTVGVFSFFPSKNLGGIGDGGMVCSSSQDLIERIALLRNHGAKPKYHHKEVGGNFRLDTIQAAVLRVMLPYLEAWTRRRRALAARYKVLFEQSGLLDKGVVVLPVERPGFRHVFNQYVIRAKERDRLATWLKEHDIGFAIYYPEPLHFQPCFRDLGYRPGSLPNAEAACEEVLALPIFPELTEAEQEEVVGRIEGFYRERLQVY